MPKYIKILTFWVLTIVVGHNAHAWEELISHEGDNYKVKLELDPTENSLRLRFKRQGTWGRFQKEGPFNVASPTKVGQSMIELESFMNRMVFTKKTQELILSRVDELKFLSGQECRALHFSLSDNTNHNSINDLIQEVEKIRLAQNPGADAFRSLLIQTFETSAEGQIQLRMVLDREGNFLKFSFAKENESLEDLSWKQSEGHVLLANASGQTLLELDLKGFNEEGGLVIVRHLKQQGLENNERSYFRLRKNLERADNQVPWEVFPYATQHFQETVIKNGVALTSGTADHTPIIQLNGSEIAFPRLNLNIIRSHEVLGILDSDKLREAEARYNRCMGERLSFSFEEHRFGLKSSELTDNDQVLICERISQLEALNFSLAHEVRQKGLSDTEKAIMLGHLRSCLERENLAYSEGDFFTIKTDEVLRATAEDFKSKLEGCFFDGKRKSIVEAVKLNLRSNDVLSRELNSDRAKELLNNSVLSRLNENCLERVPVTSLDRCMDYADILIDENLFLAQVSIHLSHLYQDESNRDIYAQKRLEIVELFNECRQSNEESLTTLIRSGGLDDDALTVIKNNEMSCAQKATLNLAALNSQKSIESALARMGEEQSREYFSDQENQARVVQGLSQCMGETFADEDSLTNLMGKISYYQESCITTALTSFAKEQLLKEFDELVEGYAFLTSESEKEQLLERASQIVERELSNWQNLEAFESIREELKVPFYTLVLTNHLNQVETRLSQDSTSSFKRTLGPLLNDHSSRPLSLKVKRFLEQAAKNSERGDRSLDDYLSVALKDTLKEVHKESMPLLTRQEIRQVVLLEEDVQELANRVDGKTQECLDDFHANTTDSFQRHYLRCEKVRIRKTALELFRRSSERRVSSFFTLTSAKANSILAPIQYLDACFEKVDPYNKATPSGYRKLIEGCQRVAELDISYNISNAKIDGYRPLLSRRGYHDAVTAYCYNIIFHHLSGEGESHIPKRGDFEGSYRDLTSMQQNQRARTPYQGSLLRYVVDRNIIEPEFAENDKRHILGLVKTFAESENYTQEWWQEKLLLCEKGTDDFINVGFREFIIESIPTLSFSTGDDTNSKLMRDFLDFELVEGLLNYKRAFQERHGANHFSLREVIPSQRTLHPELGVTAITNFIDVLGGYLSRGFIYDEGAMKTELVVFQSELKNFLRWSQDNPDRITIAEASEFFQESKLAEHLALAAISEATFHKFTSGINAMKQEELDKLFSEANCRFVSCLNEEERRKRLAIISKYQRLTDLSKEMTSSYDFRRIIHPESDRGEEIIEAVKDKILMPRILGQNVTATAEREVAELVGQAILRDNTDGGFAERFVEEAAQFALSQEENRRWAITKFFFFDSKDFDWETLKKTEAGERAINFYARYIMLPRFLDHHQSAYLKRTRLEQFRRLLTEAQSQNGD